MGDRTLAPDDFTALVHRDLAGHASDKDRRELESQLRRWWNALDAMVADIDEEMGSVKREGETLRGRIRFATNTRAWHAACRQIKTGIEDRFQRRFGGC